MAGDRRTCTDLARPPGAAYTGVIRSQIGVGDYPYGSPRTVGDTKTSRKPDQVDEMPDRSTEPASRQSVLWSELIQQLRQRGTRIQRTGGGVDEHPVTAGGGQRVTLQRNVLVAGGGHPGVPKKVAHARNVAELVRAG